MFNKLLGVIVVKEQKYEEAQEVAELVSKLIEKYHGDLANATICCMFKNGTWESKGKTIYGTAEKVPEKWKYLTDIDLLITINKEVWEAAPQEMREALVDHELTHCHMEVNEKTGEEKYSIQSHSVEDFVSIVRKYGAWTSALKQLMKAEDEFHQKSIFDEEKVS
jgi:hypothetical protein